MGRLFTAIVVVTLASAAHAEPPPPSAPEWLVAPHDPELAPLRQPSYFEQHAARVEHDMLIFDRGYTLEQMRTRDQLRLAGATPGTSMSSTLGTGLFSAAVVSAAHTPPALQFAFDRSLHLGPAILEGGAMGAGFGGLFW